jgi:hypothetical protein
MNNSNTIKIGRTRNNFRTAHDKEILDCPKALKKPNLTVSEKSVILESLLLNKDEFVTIKLILTGLKEKVDPKICARIIGITILEI